MIQLKFDCPRRSALPAKPQPQTAPQRPWHMEHGAGGDCFAAIRGLLVVKSTAGTVHTVGCACVRYADVCEVHLCRTCVRTPPSPDHLLFVTREDRSRLAIEITRKDGIQPLLPPKMVKQFQTSYASNGLNPLSSDVLICQTLKHW